MTVLTYVISNSNVVETVILSLFVRNATRHMFVMPLFISHRMDDEKIMRDTACVPMKHVTLWRKRIVVWQQRSNSCCLCCVSAWDVPIFCCARLVGPLAGWRSHKLIGCANTTRFSSVQLNTTQHNTILNNTINSCRFHCEGMSNSWKRFGFSSCLERAVNRSTIYRAAERIKIKIHCLQLGKISTSILLKLKRKIIHIEKYFLVFYEINTNVFVCVFLVFCPIFFLSKLNAWNIKKFWKLFH